MGTVLDQLLEAGYVDVPTDRTRIGITQVVGNDKQHVGLLRDRIHGRGQARCSSPNSMNENLIIEKWISYLVRIIQDLVHGCQ